MEASFDKYHKSFDAEVQSSIDFAGLPHDFFAAAKVDALGELIRHAHDLGQGIAADFGLTVTDTKALFMLEAPMTMKDLGLRMGCDPSFVTSVADGLEKQGLARREPSQRDRRSKNLVLTPEGVQLRDRLCAELSARAPWCTSLDNGERRCLLGLMRKMLRSRGRG